MGDVQVVCHAGGTEVDAAERVAILPIDDASMTTQLTKTLRRRVR